MDTPKRRNLAERVAEELSRADERNSASASLDSVSLGGATYTKMLGKRYQ
ncbi:hypothetical protein [Saccharomonospora saliphila]|nr:hypothetical protein [Saccharomonospora saliphila]